jgi:L-rhamnose mutarotase
MNEDNKSSKGFSGANIPGKLTVHRIAFTMRLHKGQEAEYKKRHDALWPDLQLLLEETGVSDYSIFLEEASGNLFGVLKAQNPLLLKELPAHPVMQKWWAYMKDIMECNPDNSPVSIPLQEVFHME